jgi:hypothetical protein
MLNFGTVLVTIVCKEQAGQWPMGLLAMNKVQTVLMSVLA